MSILINKYIAVAESQLGLTEKGGNNRGEAVVKYQQATWLAPGPWAWCAAFMCWVLREFLINNPEAMNVLRITDINKFRCKDASAFGWIKWANGKGLYVTDEKELAKAGDLVVFDFSHIGLVVKDQLKLSDKIETIEGNTEPNTTQRDGSADGVYRMKRSPKLVKAYIRIIA